MAGHVKAAAQALCGSQGILGKYLRPAPASWDSLSIGRYPNGISHDNNPTDNQLRPSLQMVPAAIAAAMILTAPAVNAIPESQIASECAQAGGSYHT